MRNAVIDTTGAQMLLRVPGKREYVVIFRTALGGAAFVSDLSVDDMDDLRTAADEACECLLHQGREVEYLEMCLMDHGETLTLTLRAEYVGERVALCDDQVEISRAVLETLVPEVKLVQQPCGCIGCIELTFHKSV